MSSPDRDRVRLALERALSCPLFAQSGRQSSLLRYLVEKSLEGGVLKESVIGVEVYGRGAGFEPKADSIVRVEASRLRQRLAAYYTADGRDEAVRISLPRGAYRCTFELRPPERTASPARRFGMKPLAVAAMAGLAMAALAAWTMSRREVAAGPPPATFLEAHRLLKLPVDDGTPDRLRESIRLFQVALREQPGSAAAHTGLAGAYLSLADFDVPRFQELHRLAEDAAREATRIDGQADEAYFALGSALFFGKWDWEGAPAAFDRAIQLNPRRTQAHRLRSELLCILGRFDEAIGALERAQLLEPTDVSIVTQKAMAHFHSGNYEKSAAEAARALTLDSSSAQAAWVRGMAYQQMGRLEEAERVFRELPSRPKRGPLALAYLLASTGRVAEARAIAASVERERPYRWVHALVEEAAGNHTAALEHIEASRHERDVNVIYVHLDPRFRALRSHAGYGRILRELRLTPKSQARAARMLLE